MRFYSKSINLFLSLLLTISPTLSTTAQAQDRDINPPTILHEPESGSIYANQPHVISATVTDEAGIKEVKLFFRQVGSTVFNSIDMKSSDNRGVYVAEIAADQLQPPGMEYYIQAKDTADNTLLRGFTFDPLVINVIESTSGTAAKRTSNDGIDTSTRQIHSQLSAKIENESLSSKSDRNDGSTTKGDYSINEFGVSYTYFLSSIQDSEKPLDLLPFLSRSSYAFGNFYSGGYEWDRKDSDFVSEKDWTGLGFGGLFYFKPNTGIGAGFFTQSGEWKDNDDVEDDTYDEDRSGWHIRLNHYFNDYNRLSFRFSQSDRDRDFASDASNSVDYQWFLLGYDGLIGQQQRIFLGADLGVGTREFDSSAGIETEHNRSRISVTAGPVFRHLAMYVSLDYFEWNPKEDAWDAKKTTLTLSPNYWFSEQLMLGGDLYFVNYEESDDDYDYEESGTGIEIKVRYRF